MGLAARPAAERARAHGCYRARRPTHAAAVRDADVVIVDPPRRGLDDTLLAALRADPPARLVAVSCNPEAFIREARTLLAAGRLRLEAVVPGRSSRTLPTSRHWRVSRVARPTGDLLARRGEAVLSGT